MWPQQGLKNPFKQHSISENRIWMLFPKAIVQEGANHLFKREPEILRKEARRALEQQTSILHCQLFLQQHAFMSWAPPSKRPFGPEHVHIKTL